MTIFYGENYMKVYIIEVISNPYAPVSKISQEGFKTFEAAQVWCRNKPGVTEYDNGWEFVSDDYEYRIHEVLVR